MARRRRRPAPIRFGTSGWRGVLADEFTLERADAAVAAVARWLRGSSERTRVIVAHDTRLMADRFATRAAGVLVAAGIRPVLTDGPVPTPVATQAVVRRRAAAGLIFTASHNPPEYLGLKVVAPWGGAATRDITDRLERDALAILEGSPPAVAEAPTRRVDLVGSYTRALLERIDGDALRRARISVIYDAIHGTGAGVLDAALRSVGVSVQSLRLDPDARFGGGAPDPVPARLQDLGREVQAAQGLRIGLATDGDADRYGVVDADGRPLSESDALALLVDHLARTGRARRGVAISVATGSLVERIAEHHGLPVERHPIGFKHLTRSLVDGDSDVAGEESGGFAWGPFCRDKDGILAGCLLAEIVATTGAPLRTRLAELERVHGRSCCGRTALSMDPARRSSLEKLRRSPPTRFDGSRVLGCEAREGLRLQLEDGFAMLRGSGTEPALRIYAEAPGPRRLARRLAAAARLLQRAGARGR